MSYKVKLSVFEGPFDLLVYLIENARMNIYDIQVAEITNQYLAWVDEIKRLDVQAAAEFMVLAAALIEIKSKMLLPRVTMDEDGNLTMEDPRGELVERLLEYKRFKGAAEMLEGREELMLKVFEKPQEDLSPYTNEPDIYFSLDLKRFAVAFNAFLFRKKKIEDIHKTVELVERERLTTEAKIEYIQAIFKVKNRKSFEFKELLQSEGNRYEIALTFASVLEMARQQTIKLKQAVPFGRITITERGVSGEQ